MEPYRILGSHEDFLKGIAAKMKRDKPIVVQGQADLSPQDEADQSARMYWMLGYTWDEIEAILMDLEFPENIVSKAMAETKKYAKGVLSKGPFKMFVEGQLLRLKNGFIGKVASISKDFMSIRLAEGESLQVREKDIDREPSLQLKEAYALREAAEKLMREAQKEYVLPERPGAETTGVVPETKEDFKTVVKPSPGAPPGWGKDVPHVSIVEEVDATVAAMLAQIDAAEGELREVQSELKIANEMVNEVRAKKKELKGRQLEVAKQIWAVIGSQNKELGELQGTFFQKYKEKLMGLRQIVAEIPEEVGVVEELETLKTILEDNHPRIFSGVMEALDEYKEANTVINEKVEKTFALFPPAKKKVGQIKEKVVNWAKSLWTGVQNVADKLYTAVFPSIDETSDAIDDFMGTVTPKMAAYKARRVVASRRRK
jgi:hypothetical protein